MEGKGIFLVPFPFMIYGEFMPKPKKKKMTAAENYWQVFHAFCFGGNESGTYSELMDRVRFYNERQQFLKKIPKSATLENAALLLFAKRLFLGTPREIPQTQFDYLFFLVSQMQYFVDWLQDNFKVFNLDPTIDSLIAYLKPAITHRFSELNPSMSSIEEKGMLALGLAGYKGDLYKEACSCIDAWRKEDLRNDSSFIKLHCLLGSDFLPMFTEDDVRGKDTDSCIQAVYATKEKQEYGMGWAGKDISRMRADIPDLGTLIPDKESSKDWDTTKNIYIEGDNLRALKLMLKPYEGKIKMIYIDPPYNTGSDSFVYKDNFREDMEIFERLFFAPVPKEREW